MRLLCGEIDHLVLLAIWMTYRRVAVALSTHSAGGITEKDFALAQEFDGLALRNPAGGALSGSTAGLVRSA